MSDKAMKPFVKWAGGKGQLVSEIRKKYPAELGKSIKKYAEPFVGGGAILFDVLNNYELDEVYISDTNAELINVYRILRDDLDSLLAFLREYQEEYLPLTMDNRKDYYYGKRDRFNELKRAKVLNVEMAALFIFLNRTCFNGLYRVNSKGDYNVPAGYYKKPRICDEDNLRKVSTALSKVLIRCGDYRESEVFMDENTFVYFDPPYRPLTVTSSFTAYTENEFGDKEQEELASYIQHLSSIGVHVVASNSDPKNIDPQDNFFDELYSKMNVARIFAARMINSNGNARGRISELLIYNC